MMSGMPKLKMLHEYNPMVQARYDNPFDLYPRETSP